jgi:HSP20 family molecular chaperone IbpA
MDTDSIKSTKNASKRSIMAIGGAAILAIGVLLGFVITKYATGIPIAAAATKSPQNLPPPVVSSAQSSAGSVEWNPFQEIRDMQLHMDQMFDRMNSQFRLEPRLSLFTDNPGYSLSLRMRDLKDHYEVHAYLSDAKASDVNVSLLDKQTLKVEVSNKSTETSSQKAESASVTEWGQYAQIIHLPVAVKSEQMKIDHANHELLVTLPKA